MRILLGVTGGIAAYKAVEFVRLAGKAGHQVRVIQTPNSVRFIGSETFSGITGAPVLTSQFEADPLRGVYPADPLPQHVPISHLALVENADLYLIAPATANAVSDLACGRAQNLIGVAALAATCPVVVAPAMNSAMYQSPAVVDNIKTLKSRGITVIEPESGQLASKGEYGVGRLPDPERLLQRCTELLAGGVKAQEQSDLKLAGSRVLITAGGTREPIDSVRYIGNHSSGRMGLALAEAAKQQGAQVTVIAANVTVERPAGVSYIDVTTAAELAAASKEQFVNCDVLLMAAAVADFRPDTVEQSKIKKSGRNHLELKLVATEDVLKTLSAQRKHQLVIGFAAEHGAKAVEYGQKKLLDKRLDLVVVNDISREDIGFNTADNEVHLVSSEGVETVHKAEKIVVAERILQRVIGLLAKPKLR